MQQLNLPAYQFKIKKQNNKFFVFDTQRKRYVTLTPEEWVRQHFVRFLIEEMNYPAALLALEYQFDLNGMKKRCDIVLFDQTAQPSLIIELKAPHVIVTQQTFDQVAVYNSKLNVRFFMISNGLEHFFCKVNLENFQYEFLSNIPKYSDFVELRLK